MVTRKRKNCQVLCKLNFRKTKIRPLINVESTTVSSVKTMVKKMFGLNDDCDVKLIWKTNKDEEFEYTLEEDEHPLSYYSVDDDDVIHVTQ